VEQSEALGGGEGVRDITRDVVASEAGHEVLEGQGQGQERPPERLVRAGEELEERGGQVRVDRPQRGAAPLAQFSLPPSKGRGPSSSISIRANATHSKHACTPARLPHLRAWACCWGERLVSGTLPTQPPFQCHQPLHDT
jgi:hypothetical protein